ncbi:hypothetical protein [Haloechinothrix halophila]|uniref:hypothetical protein n=1 Tax=Haloechinothrix halophila TaxID=1069073 RepID=UPI0003FD4D7A|nr:hypothetical protein [Haloechinothrix halophila]
MMRRAGVLLASVLLALLTGCEPGDGDTAAAPTSTVPDLAAHTSVLELVRAADEAVKQRGTALFQLTGGTPNQQGGQPTQQGATPNQQGGQPQQGGQLQGGQPTRQGSASAQPRQGAAPAGRDAGPARKPLGAGRLAYREQGVDVLVRTVRRKQNIEYRVVGDALFAQPTGRLMSIARGMPWIKVPATSANPLSRILDPAMVQAPSTVDPTRTFDLLVAAGTIADSERTRLGDAEVTRYDIDLDIARLAEHVGLSTPGQSRQPLVTALQALADQGTTTATVTVMLDRHDLPRRIQLVNLSALPRRGPDAGPTLPMITVNYRNWGKPPVVAPPPAGTVATVPG